MSNELFFSYLCLGSHLETPKGQIKLNYSMGLMKYKIWQQLLTKQYNTFYPEKKCLHLPLPVTLPYLSVPNSLTFSYPQTATGGGYKSDISTIITIILSCMQIYSLRSTDLGFCQITKPHQQVKHN